jgi:hypothetical protein
MSEQRDPSMLPSEILPLFNENLAADLIDRLNALIEHEPLVGDLLGVMFAKTIVIADREGNLRQHPTLQVWAPGEIPEVGEGEIGITLIGLLNGIVGTIPSGRREGWGYIAAVREKDGRISSFERTDLSKSKDGPAPDAENDEVKS